MDLNDVSIIVPTKNERENIATFASSLPPEVQLIVVDASTDDTREVLRRVRPRNTVVLYDEGNIATARQRGAELAVTDWLLYTDADVEFAPDFFARLQNLRVRPRHGGFVGVKTSRRRYRRYYRFFNFWLRIFCRLGLPGASGSNMLIRRRALFAAGGFDCALSCNEDSVIMWQIRRAGYRVDFAGKLKVYEFDHRRLERGIVKKTLHSILRCLLLFAGAFPQTLRENDWGYWREKPRARSAGAGGKQR